MPPIRSHFSIFSCIWVDVNDMNSLVFWSLFGGHTWHAQSLLLVLYFWVIPQRTWGSMQCQGWRQPHTRHYPLEYILGPRVRSLGMQELQGKSINEQPCFQSVLYTCQDSGSDLCWEWEKQDDSISMHFIPCKKGNCHQLGSQRVLIFLAQNQDIWFLKNEILVTFSQDRG